MRKQETAEELLAWLQHPAGRGRKLARLEELLSAEAEAALLRATMREVVIELEDAHSDEAKVVYIHEQA